MDPSISREKPPITFRQAYEENVKARQNTNKPLKPLTELFKDAYRYELARTPLNLRKTEALQSGAAPSRAETLSQRKEILVRAMLTESPEVRKKFLLSAIREELGLQKGDKILRKEESEFEKNLYGYISSYVEITSKLQSTEIDIHAKEKYLEAQNKLLAFLKENFPNELEEINHILDSYLEESETNFKGNKEFSAFVGEELKRFQIVTLDSREYKEILSFIEKIGQRNQNLTESNLKLDSGSIEENEFSPEYLARVLDEDQEIRTGALAKRIDVFCNASADLIRGLGFTVDDFVQYATGEKILPLIEAEIVKMVKAEIVEIETTLAFDKAIAQSSQESAKDMTATVSVPMQNVTSQQIGRVSAEALSSQQIDMKRDASAISPKVSSVLPKTDIPKTALLKEKMQLETKFQNLLQILDTIKHSVGDINSKRENFSAWKQEAAELEKQALQNLKLFQTEATLACEAYVKHYHSTWKELHGHHVPNKRKDEIKNETDRLERVAKGLEATCARLKEQIAILRLCQKENYSKNMPFTSRLLQQFYVHPAHFARIYTQHIDKMKSGVQTWRKGDRVVVSATKPGWFGWKADPVERLWLNAQTRKYTYNSFPPEGQGWRQLSQNEEDMIVAKIGLSGESYEDPLLISNLINALRIRAHDLKPALSKDFQDVFAKGEAKLNAQLVDRLLILSIQVDRRSNLLPIWKNSETGLYYASSLKPNDKYFPVSIDLIAQELIKIESRLSPDALAKKDPEAMALSSCVENIIKMKLPRAPSSLDATLRRINDPDLIKNEQDAKAAREALDYLSPLLLKKTFAEKPSERGSPLSEKNVVPEWDVKDFPPPQQQPSELSAASIKEQVSILQNKLEKFSRAEKYLTEKVKEFQIDNPYEKDFIGKNTDANAVINEDIYKAIALYAYLLNARSVSSVRGRLDADPYTVLKEAILVKLYSEKHIEKIDKITLEKDRTERARKFKGRIVENLNVYIFTQIQDSFNDRSKSIENFANELVKMDKDFLLSYYAAIPKMSDREKYNAFCPYDPNDPKKFETLNKSELKEAFQPIEKFQKALERALLIRIATERENAKK